VIRTRQNRALVRRGWLGRRRIGDDDRVRVPIPLPDRDFDVTEVAVPWRLLCDAGHQVVFATERAGTVAAADPRLLTGVIFGQLGAAAEARRFYAELAEAAEFSSTQAWQQLDPAGRSAAAAATPAPDRGVLPSRLVLPVRSARGGRTDE
jgi:hypothetical protein